MSEFTKGKWVVKELSTTWGVFAMSEGKCEPVADCFEKADARLIAAAPEMYNWIEKTCCFLHDLKRYAHDEDEMRDHAEDLNATYNNLLTDAYLMLVRIDGEEAQS